MHRDLVATAYVYDPNTNEFLLIFHNKLHRWLPPGGHLLPGEPPHEGALRELFEEVGVRGEILDLDQALRLRIHDATQLPTPFAVLSELIPATSRASPEHLHVDFIYVVSITHLDSFMADPDEIATPTWFPISDLDGIDTFDNVRAVCLAISSLVQNSFIEKSKPIGDNEN